MFTSSSVKQVAQYLFESIEILLVASRDPIRMTLILNEFEQVKSKIGGAELTSCFNTFNIFRFNKYEN